MSLFCDSDMDTDGCDWWWYQPQDETPLATKRSRRCCSCGAKVSVGNTARTIVRYRPPTEFEEMRGITCDEVPMSDWYLCETCGDLADSLSELGFCYTLGDGYSLKQQLKEYREAEQEDKERTARWNATHNAIGQGSAACGASPAPTGCAANGTNDERTDK